MDILMEFNSIMFCFYIAFSSRERERELKQKHNCTVCTYDVIVYDVKWNFLNLLIQ